METKIRAMKLKAELLALCLMLAGAAGAEKPTDNRARSRDRSRVVSADQKGRVELEHDGRRTDPVEPSPAAPGRDRILRWQTIHPRIGE